MGSNPIVPEDWVRGLMAECLNGATDCSVTALLCYLSLNCVKEHFAQQFENFYEDS